MRANSIRLTTFLLALAASACSSPRAADRPTPAPEAKPAPSGPSAVAAPQPSEGDALADIRALEDARHPAVGELASHASAAVRARSARALGRVLAASADPLGALLDDADAAVRAEAAFAIGMRAEKRFFDALLARSDAAREADPLVRARAVEAASKLDLPERRAEVLAALADADPRVRLEAAQGASRWPTMEAGAVAVDRALVAHLAQEADADVITYALFALERRKALDAVDVFLRFAESQDARHRIFAVRGLVALVESRSLAMLDATRAATAALDRTDDHDWRVMCEAAPVFKTSVDEAHVPAYPLGHENANVRVAMWRVIGDWIASTTDRLTVMKARGWVLHEDAGALIDHESSPYVWAAGREAQLRVYARLLKDQDELAPKEVPFESLLSTQPLPADDPIALAGIARGLADAPTDLFERAIAPYLRHTDVRVAAAAIESLAKHPTPESRATLHELCYHSDNGIRLAALGALDAAPDASDLAHVEWAFERSEGDIAPEVRFNALRLAAKIGGDDAVALLVRGLEAAEPFVRSVARAELAKLAPARLAEHDGVPTEREPAPGARPVAFPAWTRHPIVDVRTTRGTLRFELFPDEAPYHVHNFLQLAARGYYDGLTFHRVVPDFVVQGGDYRGDGNGGTTFRVEEDARALRARGGLVPHDSLRHEIGPRKYVRGSLGMPRNDDLDSGGSQFFVTHRETPHLDGRYTLFGELRDGFDALDSIEVGDAIESVTVVDPGL